MKKQKSKRTNGVVPSNKEVNVSSGVSKSVIISGDNNTVNVGVEESKSVPPKKVPQRKRPKLLKKLHPEIVAAIITATATIIVGFATYILNNKPHLDALPTATAALPFIAPTKTFASTLTPAPVVELTSTYIPTNTVAATLMPSLTSQPAATITLTSTPTSVVILDHNVPMSLIPSGFFQMYDEQGVLKTYVNSFYVDQHEVTNAQYRECVITKACTEPYTNVGTKYVNVVHYGDSGYDNFPVILISWGMAESFCRWRDARLPTNIEWEKAARGLLVNQPYPWGDKQPSCDEGSQNGANFSLCGSNDAFPVMQFSPNGYGLFDMAGNVGEWVNNSASISGASYLIRGGSWLSSSSQLKFESASYSADAAHGFVDTGFRCARDANP